MVDIQPTMNFTPGGTENDADVYTINLKQINLYITYSAMNNIET